MTKVIAINGSVEQRRQAVNVLDNMVMIFNTPFLNEGQLIGIIQFFQYNRFRALDVHFQIIDGPVYIR